ncbi:MAG: hypothetical protein KGD63_04635 [Candidatus Lokiarchaeota archaeon]|nr:hypothetical protein [Candidatus Lokiarchaeota archaeon]
MKKKVLNQLLIIVLIVYVLALILAVVIFRFLEDFLNEYISMIPFIVAIPAALLTRAFQRRSSYINTLRGIWPSIVNSGIKAIEYTNIKNPTEEQFREVIISLSTSIDHLRMLFKNVGGFYPVESIKTIYEEFNLIRDTFKFRNPTNAYDRITALWHQARDSILAEFDRVIPTAYDAPELVKTD